LRGPPGHRWFHGDLRSPPTFELGQSGILVLLVRLTVDILTATLCFGVLTMWELCGAGEHSRLEFHPSSRDPGSPKLFARLCPQFGLRACCCCVPYSFLPLLFVLVYSEGRHPANKHRDSMVNSIHLSSRKFCRPFINRVSFNSSCRSCYCLCASELEDKSARDLSIFFLLLFWYLLYSACLRDRCF